MKIEVRLFAVARQLANQETITVSCPESATIADLKQAIIEQLPELATILDHVRFAVNSDYADEKTQLSSTDEVACIPPVSGG